MPWAAFGAAEAAPGGSKNFALTGEGSPRIGIDVDKRTARSPGASKWGLKKPPRSRVHAELMSYGIGGQYVALVVGRFGEFSKDFIKLRDYITRQKASALVEHFNSTVISATS